jgi:phospholipid/cholesterol/gamma-HCH transport system ATP-binding protein
MIKQPVPTAETNVEFQDAAVESTAPAIVRLVDVRKSFRWVPVLRGISVEFPTGKTTVVLGPSGCGKSVMLKHIVGLLRPDAGEIWFDDTRVDTLSEARLVPIRKQFGFLFQQSALFDSMSVRDNIAFPLLEHTKLTESQRLEKIRHVLAMVGLEEAIDKMPADLSGGQRKRAALARAIILDPKVILYDEPTTGLDPIRSDVINELILKLQRELHVTSIVVTHDLGSAFKIADRVVMLHEGHVAFSGTPDELKRSQDKVVQRFLRGEASEEELAAIQRVSANGASQSKTVGESA